MQIIYADFCVVNTSESTESNGNQALSIFRRRPSMNVQYIYKALSKLYILYKQK